MQFQVTIAILSVLCSINAVADPSLLIGKYSEDIGTKGNRTVNLIISCATDCEYVVESTYANDDARIRKFVGKLVIVPELAKVVNDDVSSWTDDDRRSDSQRKRDRMFKSAKFDLCFEAPIVSTEPKILIEKWKNHMWILCRTQTNSSQTLNFLGRLAKPLETGRVFGAGTIYKRVKDD